MDEEWAYCLGMGRTSNAYFYILKVYPAIVHGN